MRYIHSASAKWSLRAQPHGQMITFVTPNALLLFIDTVGREKIRTCNVKNGELGEGGRSGLSNMVVVRHYLPSTHRVLHQIKGIWQISRAVGSVITLNLVTVK